MHITILALGSRGDIQPYAALGQGLIAAGYQVRFISFESFAALIAEHGLDFHPIRGNAQALTLPPPPTCPPDVEAIVASLKAYGTETLGPPPSA